MSPLIEMVMVVGDNSDAFPDNLDETVDSDVDGIGDNSDNCPNMQNSDQTNTDGDLFGNACDLDDDNDGFTDAREEQDGTDPLNRFSCKSGCFSFDVDENLEAQPLTDGLLVIRHLFGFSGESLNVWRCIWRGWQRLLRSHCRLSNGC